MMHDGGSRSAMSTGGLARTLGRTAFASLFLIAGVGHIRSPDLFVRIMPPSIPHPRAMVLISGGFEILLGVLLLVPRTTRVAAWGLIGLLIAVFPANLYMYEHAELFPGPPVVYLLRLPLQALLIWWAYGFTTRPGSPREDELA